MPRIPIDYSKTLIYKLVHKDDLENENIYIGSTTDFRRRKNQHKNNCYNPNSKTYNRKVYEQIRENDGWDTWVMVEIEKFPCTDKREADARERYWCEYFKSELNMVLPGRTIQEWRETNKEKIKTKRDQEYADNIEKHHKEQKIYRDELGGRDKMMKYRQNHNEELIEYNKRKYEKNREKILEQLKIKNNKRVTCECGLILSQGGLSRHKRNTCTLLQVA